MLLTQYGRIADLRVPKLRRGNRELKWHTIERYERRSGPLLDHLIMRDCLALSLRDLQEVLYETLGEVVSLSSCNRLLWEVDKQIKAWKSAVLEVLPAVVMVDGMWVKIADPTGDHCLDAQGRLRAVKHKEKRVVLSALALWDDGHCEIVHWQIATGENQAAWHHFLGNSTKRASPRRRPSWWSVMAARVSKVLSITTTTRCLTSVVSFIRSKTLLTIWCFTS